MLREQLRSRYVLVLVLLAVAMTASACYKNAGENVQPTSNRVDLEDLQVTNTPLPTAEPVEPTATQALEPTPTDALSGPDEPDPTATTAPSLAPTITPADEEPPAGDSGAADASATPRIAPSFTPRPTIPPDQVIATPGMSELRPSSTPEPTLDPANMPTPTAIPPEENPCIHVVSPGDTLYSLARDYEVELSDLVAANPTLLTAGANTVLQLGWQLQLPGCATETPTPAPTAGDQPTADPNIAPGPTEPPAPPAPGTGTTHVVQAGDTVYSIARRYGVTPQAIIDANNLQVSGNVVYISLGQELVIPPAP